MNRLIGIALLALASTASAAQPSPATAPAADLATSCQGRDGWTDPAPPERLFGNTWYVGTCGITALLITSEEGHVLIDGGPQAAAPLVAANIERLGFRAKDIRWIVSSHEHDDHVGALAELKQLTGARLAALQATAPLLAAGRLSAEDPQQGAAHPYPPVAVDRVLQDGHDLRIGSLKLTGYATPTHSPGSASWTWQSCDQTRCRTITYADSVTTISADAYRFSDHPERVAAVRRGFERMRELPCGVLVTPHPSASGLFARMAGRAPLADTGACHGYVTAAEARFAARLAQEQGQAE